ncbi:MAG: hypothetical protein COA96_08570 [SAR86 cluster bacterium]|uniref:DUF2946 domain-containing protein n=1 Tax=SAR86 cluster bacterium TaxID=2030880 RepID=A0A2A5AZY8_9GAMM|nr:MAG: hypothetical protein COA96_08570 [SAR86 cluster bacterium]
MFSALIGAWRLVKRMKFVKNNSLIGFLVFLLFSNSALALEFVAHDTHGANVVHETHSSQDQSMSMPLDQLDSTLNVVSIDQLDEECVCEDICCVSTVEFGADTGSESIPDFDGNASRQMNFYQSVALDLILPPPTA